MGYRTVASLLLAAWCASVSGSQPTHTPIGSHDLQRIVRAIYLAEGGDKARVPYGILSVKVRSKDHAKQVCERTVINSHARWVQSGKRESFIKYLGSTYCPKSSDPVGHENWVRNVTALSR